jgi:hypothetical protein
LRGVRAADDRSDASDAKPHETKKREAFYASIQGKRELLQLMLAYCDARDKILEKSEQPTEAADDDYAETP